VPGRSIETAETSVSTSTELYTLGINGLVAALRNVLGFLPRMLYGGHFCGGGRKYLLSGILFCFLLILVLCTAFLPPRNTHRW
jgi:hypothetical protein